MHEYVHVVFSLVAVRRQPSLVRLQAAGRDEEYVDKLIFY